MLRPRVFLVQENFTNLFQNIAVKYNLEFFDLRRESFKDISIAVRKNTFRNIVLCNYKQNTNSISEDFDEIERLIGDVRYLAIFTPEAKEVKD